MARPTCVAGLRGAFGSLEHPTSDRDRRRETRASEGGGDCGVDVRTRGSTRSRPHVRSALVHRVEPDAQEEGEALARPAQSLAWPTPIGRYVREGVAA